MPTTDASSGGSPVEVGELTFIGTATVLLRVAGFTILTDPNFLHQGQHAKLGGGLRSKRLTNPAMEIGDLPPLDLVVLSHHHGDHFDEVAIARLDKRVPIVTTPHAARKLRRQGFQRPVALRTWETHDVANDDATLSITSLPGKHAPDPLARVLPPVMGSVLEITPAGAPQPFRIHITGDTLMHDRLEEIPQRYPDLDLSLLHLGGTRIAGILLTMDAAQGVAMLRLVRPRTAIPIHYDDYTVFRSPLSDFRDAVAQAELDAEVVWLARGHTHRFPLT
ncbi:MBL fold metallo-hydrolase [Egicoccus sp. AB-alg6-2]|uniref:MBL fold metallo-hydrolase n=1 Tax=Egicoccus sp. AB-alg6-2 TaxID=3242692 RepID=UPI00359E824F